MNVAAITMLIWFGLATIAAAQGTPSGKAASPGASSKTQLSEIRSLVRELEGRTGKLSDLMEQYRSLVAQRPQPQGGSPEAKKGGPGACAPESRAAASRAGSCGCHRNPSPGQPRRRC